jgi:hypothetical protein
MKDLRFQEPLGSYIKRAPRLPCGHTGVTWRREDGTPALGPADGGQRVACSVCGQAVILAP